MDKVWLFVVEKVHLLWTLLKCTSESQLGDHKVKRRIRFQREKKSGVPKRETPKIAALASLTQKGPLPIWVIPNRRKHGITKIGCHNNLLAMVAMLGRGEFRSFENTCQN